MKIDDPRLTIWLREWIDQGVTVCGYSMGDGQQAVDRANLLSDRWNQMVDSVRRPNRQVHSSHE